ncbi:MAG: AgmX/PglI C-terminal domain-containing protein [Polyangiaceae bacterium]|nr:AgmX/PglI C-terminal domain-containing protein [Polyangiaceae bacterium]
MRRLAPLLLALGAPACGSEQRAREPPRPEPRPGAEPAAAGSPESAGEARPRATRPERPRRAPAEAPTVIGETGGLDPDAVARVLAEREATIDRCWDRALERQPHFSGAVRLRVRVGASGRAVGIAVVRSSSGDRAFERCLAAALSEPSWPRPVGGKSGVIEQDYTFPPPDAAPSAATWSHVEIAQTRPLVQDELARCGAGPALSVTAYVASTSVDPADAGAFSALVDAGDAGDAAPFEIGVARTAGVAAPEGTPEAALDCAVEATLRVAWPSPGAGVAKVTIAP